MKKTLLEQNRLKCKDLKTIFKSILNLLPRPLLIRLSYVVRPLIAWYLKGDKYTDPIDGKSFRKFLPYGYTVMRENALSPSTFSLERHRLLWLYLKNETTFFTASKKMLHIAPEQCFINRFKQLNNLDYVTVDLHSPIADIKADICNLPFSDNSFDIIFCNHVLEHIENDTKAMQELFRVLRPAGFGVFQIPQDLNRVTTFEDNTITNTKERTKLFGQYDHVRIYGRDYFNALRAVGFIVNEVDYTTCFSNEEITRYCLAKGEILPIVSK